MIWINLKRKELTKEKTFTKNNWYDWYDWLIKYFPEPIKISEGEIKDQVMSLFKTKDYSKPEPMYGGGRKQCEENIIKRTKNLFKPKKEKEGIKDRIIRDTRTLFK